MEAGQDAWILELMLVEEPLLALKRELREKRLRSRLG
jgi:hypothetical protein